MRCSKLPSPSSATTTVCWCFLTFPPFTNSFSSSLSTEVSDCTSFTKRGPPHREEDVKHIYYKKKSEKVSHLSWSPQLLPVFRVSEVWDKVIFRWKDGSLPSVLPARSGACTRAHSAAPLFVSEHCAVAPSIPLVSLPLFTPLSPFLPPSIHSPRGSWMLRHSNRSWKAPN